MRKQQSCCAPVAVQQAHLAASCQISGMQSLTIAAGVNPTASVYSNSKSQSDTTSAWLLMAKVARGMAAMPRDTGTHRNVHL